MLPSERPEWKTFYHAIQSIEADELYRHASQVPKGGQIVEIGSFTGSSTFALAMGAAGHDVKVHSVDTWMGSPGGPCEWLDRIQHPELKTASTITLFRLHCKEWLDAGTVVMHEMSSAGALMLDPPLTPNLLFIDGSHVFEDVFFDLSHWFPRLETGGIMGVHDSTGDLRYHPQVKQALDAFCQRTGQTPTHMTGSTAWIQKS